MMSIYAPPPQKWEAGWAKPPLAPQFRCLCIDTAVDPEIFQGRGGMEKENFERKMFVDTHINP